MKELVNIFIKRGLPSLSLDQLEEFTIDWMKETSNKYRDIVLPYLINQKLLKYEEEY